MAARSRHLLTDREVKSAKFKGKQRKLSDGGGLYVLLKEAGKYWRLKYHFRGAEKVLALGVYPDVTLKQAREEADKARALVAKGFDPVEKRRFDKTAKKVAATNSVEGIAREWHDEVHKHKTNPTHSGRNLRRLELYLFPYLGLRAISEVTAPELLDVLRRIESKNKIETAHRVKFLCGQVWRYAISTGRADRDIAHDLRDCLKPTKVKHHAAVIDANALGGLLLAIDGYTGFPAASAALQLTPLLFCRPGELRTMTWESLELDKGIWHYKPSKGGGAMITPLPRQAIEILNRLHPITGSGNFVFPSVRGDSRPMSENTINAALINLGFGDQQTAHGFRATARTLLVEVLGFPESVVEMQLAHQVKDSNGRAYNRTTFLDQRREMLQAWADYLDSLKASTTKSALKIAV